MSSKFENFAIGRAVAKFLNIKDPKNFPVQLNTDELQGVLSIAGPNPEHVYLSSDLIPADLNTKASYFFNTLGLNSAYADAAAAPLFTDLSKGHFLRQFNLQLSYDNAGSITESGRFIAFIGYIFDPATVRQLKVLQHVVEIKNALTVYELAWPESDLPSNTTLARIATGGIWNGYIPPGFQFALGVNHYTGGGLVFPANTSLYGKILMAEVTEGYTYTGPT